MKERQGPVRARLALIVDSYVIQRILFNIIVESRLEPEQVTNSPTPIVYRGELRRGPLRIIRHVLFLLVQLCDRPADANNLARPIGYYLIVNSTQNLRWVLPENSLIRISGTDRHSLVPSRRRY